MYIKQILDNSQSIAGGKRLTITKLTNALGLLGLCSLMFFFSCGKSPSSGGDVVDKPILVYAAPPEADALKDSRLRELVPSQTQGTFGQVKCGDDNGLSMDYIVMDSSVTFLDSISAGREIIACTLWVKLGTMPDNDNDSVVLDMWSVPESWNENEVCWESRAIGVEWQNTGGLGTLVDSAIIIVKRISMFSFEWRIGGVLYDTLVLEDGIAVPIPIDSVLAGENLKGISYGFALRRNPATSSNARISIITIDNLQPNNRPSMVWAYR